MSDTVQVPLAVEPKRVPGPVIFVAIMNFLSVSVLGILSALASIALIFGNVLGLYDFVSSQVNHYMPNPNYSYGLTFLFGVILAFCLSFVVFFILLGIGLLRGNKVAWYIQVVLCVLSLFAFPVGTILNGVILFLFFRQPIRDYFKV